MDDRHSALLIIDVQNDFCPGGALPVPEGDQVVPVLSRLAERAGALGLPVYASRDWHPPESVHFKSGGGPWPVHCVAGTPGAQFHPDLRLPPGTMIVSAGTSGEDDGYSAFEGTVAGRGSFEADLRARGVTHLIVGGLATDYCVRASVLDARRLGIDVTVVSDAVRAIDVQPGDGERALKEMREAGAELKKSDEIF
ncbi:MAG TPA: nicotinamidase [Vicinamibacterales bacterium]